MPVAQHPMATMVLVPADLGLLLLTFLIFEEKMFSNDPMKALVMFIADFLRSNCHPGLGKLYFHKKEHHGGSLARFLSATVHVRTGESVNKVQKCTLRW
jgi:hypothetical protein